MWTPGGAGEQDPGTPCAQVTRTPAGMGAGLEEGCLPLGLLLLPRPQGEMSPSSAQASWALCPPASPATPTTIGHP